MTEPGQTTLSGPAVFNTLTVTTAMQAGPPVTAQLILTGTATAAVSSQIGLVESTVYTCPGTVAPAALCQPDTGSNPGLTGRILATPIAVEPGQQIQVRVEISFS